MARGRRNKQKTEDLTLIYPEYDESFGAVMVPSKIHKVTGFESKASISRVNAERWDGKNEGNEMREYYHIHNAASPFLNDRCNGVSAEESIELCQKAFYCFPAFRNPIIMQAYLANSQLHFNAEDKKIEKFFESWAQDAKIWDLANQWFLEWFRSGNVFPYKFEAELKLADVKKIASEQSQARNRKIPLKYIILNPADIRGLGSSFFDGQFYGKVLNAYEVKMLQLRKTEEDQRIYDSLSPEEKKQVDQGNEVLIKLNPERLRPAFNAKQSYEPMAVPPYFGVLKSINFKQSLRSAEEKVAASADYCILLVTAGEKELPPGTNKKIIEGIASLFAAQSIGRVLFAHHTAKAGFVIPDLNKIFGPQKYEDVNKDIISGMYNLMDKEENFATGQVKTKLYLELLSQARESFIQYFLVPEMKAIAKELGFSEVPDVKFEEVTLDSLNEARKLYNRMYELGVLTPGDLLHAYETNQLPEYNDSLKSQKDFKRLKESDIYEPLMGKPSEEGGRPTGTGTPKSSNPIGPKGGTASFTYEKMKENLPKFASLMEKVEASYKSKNSLSRLSKKNREVCGAIWERIITQEPVENWTGETAAEYVTSPFKLGNEKQTEQICELMREHGINASAAGILYHSAGN